MPIGGFDSATLNQLNGNVAQTQAAKKDSTQELSDNFMTLLVTQLQNQDPLNPMQNAELTSQLAQINTVGGIDKLNETMQGINTQIGMGQSIQAAGLIGKAVMVPGDRILMGASGDATPYGLELEKFSDENTAVVRGASGEIIREIDLGALDKGVHVFEWDGKTDNGEQVPPGAYRVSIQSLGSDGELLQSSVLNYAQVNGVLSNGGANPRLDLGVVAGDVAVTDVRKIL